MTQEESPEVCALCLRNGVTLEKSHLFPKFVYKRLRIEDNNPNPVVLRNSVASQSSYQVIAKVLCGKCEDLFKVEGEDYIADDGFQENDSFPVRDFLNGKEPAFVKGVPPNQDKLFIGDSLEGLDLAKIQYFSISILWRYSIWSRRQSGFTCQLPDEAEEGFRKYLNQEAELDKNVAIHVHVADAPRAANDLEYGEVVLSPTKVIDQNLSDYRFAISGFIFHIFIGNPLPEALQQTAIGARYMFLSDPKSLGIHNGAIKLAESSKPSLKLQEKTGRKTV